MKANRLKSIRKERGLTLQELAEAVGTSKQTIHRYENGVIANIPDEKVVSIAKALEVSPAHLMGWADDTPGLPLLGSIACGEPVFASEERESYIAAGGVDADFCLIARGSSMTGARIYDGDIVFIKKQDAVSNGEIAAVIIGEEATLKRVYYYPDERKLILNPENPLYAPLVYLDEQLDGVKILGKAVAFQSKIR